MALDNLDRGDEVPISMIGSRIVDEIVNDAFESIGLALVQSSTTRIAAFTVAIDAPRGITADEIDDIRTRLHAMKLHAKAHIVRVSPQPNGHGGTTFSVEVILPRSIR